MIFFCALKTCTNTEKLPSLVFRKPWVWTCAAPAWWWCRPWRWSGWCSPCCRAPSSSPDPEPSDYNGTMQRLLFTYCSHWERSLTTQDLRTSPGSKTAKTSRVLFGTGLSRLCTKTQFATCFCCTFHLLRLVMNSALILTSVRWVRWSRGRRGCASHGTCA